MWKAFQTNKTLLDVQQHLFEELNEKWRTKIRMSILCPRQEAINETLIAFAATHKLPTLILCSDPSRYQEWQNSVAKFCGEDELNNNISELSLDGKVTPFTLSTYGFFCHSVNTTQSQRAQARQFWEYELASVGAWDKVRDNIGDFDAVKESGVMLDEEAIRRLSQYNDRLLRFIEIDREEFTDLNSPWLNKCTAEIITLLRKQKLGLIICEDTHEVTGVWAEVLNLFIRELGNCRLISHCPLRIKLDELSPRNYQLQTNLFDTNPIEIKLPLMVRNNCFKPYLGLFAICKPSEDEIEFLSRASSHLNDLLRQADDKIIISSTLSDFVKSELSLLEKDVPGNWARRREFVQSVINYNVYYKHKLPSVWKVFIDKIEQINFQQNLPVIRDYIFRVLLHSPKRKEKQLGESLLRAFQPLGYELTETKVEKGTSLVPNILARSKAKEEVLLDRLTKEFICLQRDLRALVICDFIDHSAASEIFPGNDFDDNSCGMLSVLNRLVNSTIALQLNPLVIYGDTIYFSPKFRPIIMREVEKHMDVQMKTLEIIEDKQKKYSSIRIKSCSFKSFFTPLLNSLLENKLTHCIIAGREFLSPKWDGINFNTYFNLSSANSELFGIRLLSRMLIIDQDPLPAKHLWDFACIMPNIELGMSDYERLARRKDHGWHLCEDGEFEQGISYMHPALGKNLTSISDDLIEEINLTTTRLIDTRQYTYNKWIERLTAGSSERQVLEVSINTKLDPSKRFMVCRKPKKKEVYSRLDFKEIISSMSNCVLKSLETLSPKKHKCTIHINARSEGIYRIDLLGDNEEFNNKVRLAIKQLMKPISQQHYIITISYSDSLHDSILPRFFTKTTLDMKVPFGVPDCFVKKNELGTFLKFWQQLVSNDPMAGYRLDEVKKEVEDMLNKPKYPLRPTCRICKLLL